MTHRFERDNCCPEHGFRCRVLLFATPNQSHTARFISASRGALAVLVGPTKINTALLNVILRSTQGSHEMELSSAVCSLVDSKESAGPANVKLPQNARRASLPIDW